MIVQTTIYNLVVIDSAFKCVVTFELTDLGFKNKYVL